jgi:hypothetical protein
MYGAPKCGTDPKAVDAALRPEHTFLVLGRVVSRPAVFDAGLRYAILASVPAHLKVRLCSLRCRD